MFYCPWEANYGSITQLEIDTERMCWLSESFSWFKVAQQKHPSSLEGNSNETKQNHQKNAASFISVMCWGKKTVLHLLFTDCRALTSSFVHLLVTMESGCMAQQEMAIFMCTNKKHNEHIGCAFCDEIKIECRYDAKCFGNVSQAKEMHWPQQQHLITQFVRI